MRRVPVKYHQWGEGLDHEAVMQMELTGAPVLVFRNEKNGRVNVVHRRDDGNFGWIDPTAL